MNLLFNALKHTQNGMIVIKVKIVTLNYKKYLAVQISDTGSGIEDRKLNQILQLF